jgi:hypothetical protein
MDYLTVFLCVLIDNDSYLHNDAVCLLVPGY